MINVFSPYGSEGASTRVRIYEWLDFLEIDARKSEYLGLPSNHFNDLASRWKDVVSTEFDLRRLKGLSDSLSLISREVSPFSRGGLEKYILTGSKLGIYDFDDALFAQHNEGLKSLWPKQRIWKSAVKHADTVVAGNEYLADAASKYSDDVRIIPTCVNPEDYSIKKTYDYLFHPTAVWLGSPSGEIYLKDISGPLISLNQSHGLRLKVISRGNNSLGKLDEMVDRITWSPNGYQSELASADFGIMPLPDNSYTRGKCAYKILQYAASRLPVIGSPVGVNSEVINKLSGFSAESSEDWHSLMLYIIESSSKERKSMGENAYAGVSKYYSFQSWANEWVKLITDATPREMGT